MQVIKYLHGTWNYGIIYGTSDVGLQGWTESDFIGDRYLGYSQHYRYHIHHVWWSCHVAVQVAASYCEEYM